MTVSPVTDVVVTVHRSASHTMSKRSEPAVELVEGLGVEGDAHAGATVQHLSRVTRDPTQPNLRQVHLIATELHDELAAAGLAIGAGEMGENVTTRGVDLLSLPTGSLLRLGPDAIVALTGLRNPCRQLEGVRPGLQSAVLGRAEDGELVRRAGVMAVVVAAGRVAPGDVVSVQLPPTPHLRLEPV